MKYIEKKKKNDIYVYIYIDIYIYIYLYQIFYAVNRKSIKLFHIDISYCSFLIERKLQNYG